MLYSSISVIASAPDAKELVQNHPSISGRSLVPGQPVSPKIPPCTSWKWRQVVITGPTSNTQYPTSGVYYYNRREGEYHPFTEVSDLCILSEWTEVLRLTKRHHSCTCIPTCYPIGNTQLQVEHVHVAIQQQSHKPQNLLCTNHETSVHCKVTDLRKGMIQGSILQQDTLPPYHYILLPTCMKLNGKCAILTTS